MNKKITHEIKIQKSVLIALYAILVVLSLNLVSPFFKVVQPLHFQMKFTKLLFVILFTLQDVRK